MNVPRHEPQRAETVLEEAQRLVYGDRQAAYGHPADDMGCTGAIWEALLNRIPGVTIPRGTITARPGQRDDGGGRQGDPRSVSAQARQLHGLSRVGGLRPTLDRASLAG